MSVETYCKRKAKAIFNTVCNGKDRIPLTRECLLSDADDKDVVDTISTIIRSKLESGSVTAVALVDNLKEKLVGTLAVGLERFGDSKPKENFCVVEATKLVDAIMTRIDAIGKPRSFHFHTFHILHR